MYEVLTGLSKEGISAEDAARWKCFQVMKAMGWTYREYQNTPAHIIEEVSMFLRTEKAAQDEVNNGSK